LLLPAEPPLSDTFHFAAIIIFTAAITMPLHYFRLHATLLSFRHYLRRRHYFFSIFTLFHFHAGWLFSFAITLMPLLDETDFRCRRCQPPFRHFHFASQLLRAGFAADSYAAFSRCLRQAGWLIDA
jgi:hypothetical protein